ncbi:MAG: hypothetical protein AAGE80_19440 [Pseudomonadota bacterium]
MNEAIHHGHFECAPRTRPGAARVFEVDDVVTLQIFRVLMDAGLGERAAGTIACMIREQFFGKDVEWVTYFRDLNGLSDAFAGYYDEGSAVSGFPNETMRVAFDISTYRSRIEKMLEYEASILGED